MDNISVCCWDAEDAAAIRSARIAILEMFDLQFKSEADSVTNWRTVGLSIDLRHRVLTNTPDRMWKLRGAVYGVLRQWCVSPRGMQMLVGNLVYSFAIMPGLLSVWGRVFAFAMVEDELVRDLLRAVREELRIVAALLPVLCLYVGEPFHPVLYISDNSLKGYALHRGFVGSEIATDVGGC